MLRDGIAFPTGDDGKDSNSKILTYAQFQYVDSLRRYKGQQMDKYQIHAICGEARAAYDQEIMAWFPPVEFLPDIDTMNASLDSILALEAQGLTRDQIREYYPETRTTGPNANDPNAYLVNIIELMDAQERQAETLPGLPGNVGRSGRRSGKRSRQSIREAKKELEESDIAEEEGEDDDDDEEPEPKRRRCN